MTREELIFQFRALELQLMTPEVDEFVKAQDLAFRQQFVSLTFDLRVVIMKLTTAQFGDIADRLDALAPQLQDGITKLKEEIKSLKTVTKIIGTLSTVVGLAARIVGLVL